MVVVAAVHAGAQDTTKTDPRTAQPERPTVATHAGTVATGYLELELGWEQDGGVGSPATRQDVQTLVSKIGLASHVQLELTLARAQQRWVRTPVASCAPPVLCELLQPPTGLTDPTLSLKWRLTDDDPVMGDFALQPSLKLSLGADGLTSQTTDLGVLLISSRDVGAVHIDLNLGASAPVSGNGDRSTWHGVWTASFGGAFTDRLGWTAEIYGLLDKQAPTNVGLLFGPTFALSKRAVLDVGTIRRVGGDQPNALYAGLTWNAGRLW
jgi:hypothetical protein